MAETSEAQIQRYARTAFEGRGEGITALDVRGLVEYMDFMLIVTGASARRNRAIAENLIKLGKQSGDLPISRSGLDGGSWICLDFVDVVIHIFDHETRAHYDLELLWADAASHPLDLPAEAVPAPTYADDEDVAEEGVIEPPSRRQESDA